MKCPRCEQDNPSHAKFCLECGVSIDGRARTPKPYADIKEENDRLKGENEGLRRSLGDATEQQTATAEILRLISSSPTSVEAVFDTILANALRLCETPNGGIFTFDGQRFRPAAIAGWSDEFLNALREAIILPGPETPLRRVGLGGQVSHVADILSDPSFSPPDVYRREGMRTALAVPMLKEGRLLGALTFHRHEVRPFTEKQIALIKTFADQAVIAIENVRLFNETREALDRQTATGEILRVISTSPTDLTPVLESVARNAARLCEADDVSIIKAEDDGLTILFSLGPASAFRGQRFPAIQSVTGQAIEERRTVHVRDLLADPSYEIRPEFQHFGWRSALAVPLLRDGVAIGTITARRSEVRPFSDQQITLLETFADQAVIAIENVRLFTETKEALEQQTATSEILRVISSSPTGIQPVLDAIAENAARVCGAADALIVRAEGDVIRRVAHFGTLPLLLPDTRPFTGHSMAGRAMLEGRTIHVADMADPVAMREYPESKAVRNYRTQLTVPLMHKGTAIGAIIIRRVEARPFIDKQIALLTTFADQAVIAIENVRLFTELQEKNRALTEAHAQVSEALDRQTATSDILRVIASSPTDEHPVFEAIVRSALHLLGGYSAALRSLRGNELHLVAFTSTTPEGDTALAQSSVVPVSTAGYYTRVVENRMPVVVEDTETDSGFPSQARIVARARGYRSLLSVPLLRGESVLGVLNVSRRTAGPFSGDAIALLQTFADQAVIAIENVRLFTELQEKNRALTAAHAQVTEALQHQTATSEILQVISRSPTDVQPVFDTIIRSAVRLLGGFSGLVTQIIGDHVHLAALTSTNPSGDAAQKALWPRPVKEDVSVHGQVITSLASYFITDVESDRSVPPSELAVSRARGWRSIVAVPLLRDGRAIGSLAVTRSAPGAFADGQVALLQTFADQAVIAIENVRLFTELEARTQDLTRSVSELRALGEVSHAITSTLDLQTVLTTIVSRAVELSNGSGGVIYEYDQVATVFELRAAHNVDHEVMALQKSEPIRIGEGAVGRAVAIRAPVQIADLRETQHFAARVRVRELLIARGYLSVLAVPLLVEDEILGALVVLRQEASELGEETVELMKTFATQSALAIQNARLFREIEQKSRELEAASRHKSEFLANMSHELRTPLNAIIGFSEVLSEKMFGELNEKQEEYSKDIHASGQHLLSLINDILDLSKIEAGKMELELSDFDVPMTIDNALMLIRERAARRSIALNTAVDEQVGQVHADERKIRQVLLNLLSNAIKFTPEGGRIHVEARAVNESIEVSVTDTGVGIAPEDQEAVFEEFRQVGTADKKVEGTGLGLALSRKFIELHGGKIWVKSQVGAGSTFTFTVPVRRGE